MGLAGSAAAAVPPDGCKFPGSRHGQCKKMGRGQIDI
jgi:hypothetical protein